MIRPCITAHRSQRSAGHGTRARATAIAACGLAALMSLAAAVPAIAGESSSVTATINVAPPSTASVVVGPTAVTYGSCSGSDPNELTFPNGTCTAPDTTNGQIAVEDNGSAAETIDVAGGSARPNSMNANERWTLCPAAANPQCMPMGPGQNEFSELLSHVANGGSNLYLTETAACDEAFDSDGGCVAAAGETQGERLSLTGPIKSTVSATTFTTQITWTAVASQ